MPAEAFCLPTLQSSTMRTFQSMAPPFRSRIGNRGNNWTCFAGMSAIESYGPSKVPFSNLAFVFYEAAASNSSSPVGLTLVIMNSLCLANSSLVIVGKGA